MSCSILFFHAFLGSVALSAEARQQQKQQQQLYNNLYRLGYHSNSSFSHSTGLVRAVAADRSVRTILDFGCSHGLAVSRLWGLGKAASGYDVSQVAVIRAAALRRSPRRSCLPSVGCFFSDPDALQRLAQPDASVDAVLSSDVLEHLVPSQVNATLDLLTKIARRRIFVKIASTKEYDRTHLNRLPHMSRPPALHATLRPFAWWIAAFAWRGFGVQKRLSADSAVFFKK